MNVKTISIAVVAAVAVAVMIVAAVDHGDRQGSGNGTDVAFVADMTRHHQGAVDMATLAEAQSTHPEIRALAKSIIAAQRGEISTMERIGEDMHMMGTHGEDHMGLSDHAMGMGMDMGALERARPFDRAFLDAMIAHHEGAIRMARHLLASGEQPGLHRMAQDIITDQTKEIAQMRAWRTRWYGTAASAHMSPMGN